MFDVCMPKIGSRPPFWNSTAAVGSGPSRRSSGSWWWTLPAFAGIGPRLGGGLKSMP